MSEKILYERHPSTFRSRPLAYILACILSLVGVGLIIHLVWWLRSKGTRLTLTETRSTLRRGILARHITEVYHADVRNIELRQSLTQRIFGVGSIGISSAGQADMEISVDAMPDPDRIKEIIDAHRSSGRRGSRRSTDD